MNDFHHDERLLFGTILGSFIVLTLVIAVGPAVQMQSAQEPLPDSEPMTDLERRGLEVYVNEGCAYCHTQQVRPVPMDDDLGRPSVVGDYARLERPGVWRQTPAVLGSERTGPDLTTIGERQPSEQWHYVHLYNPRAVVSDSVMPSFEWLFRVVDEPADGATTVSVPEPYGPDDGQVVATERGEALVAYLTSLEQAPLPEGMRPSEGEEKGAGGQSTGESLYESECASCHQSDGSGVAGTFPPLDGDPVVTDEDPTRHVEIVLEGLQGKKIDGTAYSAAMPGFADRFSDEEVAAVVNHERTSWNNDAPTVDPERVAEIRKALGLTDTED